jgi:hypothetical protein
LICDSGSANLVGSVDAAQSNFTFLAGLVGCSNLAPAPELACVRNVSAITLENALSNYLISGVKPTISFTPFFDNKTAFSNITDRAVRGLVAKLVGFALVLYSDLFADSHSLQFWEATQTKVPVLCLIPRVDREVLPYFPLQRAL